MDNGAYVVFRFVTPFNRKHNKGENTDHSLEKSYLRWSRTSEVYINPYQSRLVQKLNDKYLKHHTNDLHVYIIETIKSLALEALSTS